jgi:hypothetical protein
MDDVFRKTMEAELAMRKAADPLGSMAGAADPAAESLHVNRHAFGTPPHINGKYPPAEPGALGIGPLEAATLDPKLYLFGRRTKYSLPTSPRPFIQIFLRHFGEQMPLDNCVATWWG